MAWLLYPLVQYRCTQEDSSVTQSTLHDPNCNLQPTTRTTLDLTSLQRRNSSTVTTWLCDQELMLNNVKIKKDNIFREVELAFPQHPPLQYISLKSHASSQYLSFIGLSILFIYYLMFYCISSRHLSIHKCLHLTWKWLVVFFELQ